MPSAFCGGFNFDKTLPKETLSDHDQLDSLM